MAWSLCYDPARSRPVTGRRNRGGTSLERPPMAINGITTATFDCYGTLIDWEGGLATFLYDFALRQGDDNAPDGNSLRERWEAIQFDIAQGPFKPYVDVLAESLRLWATERGYPY